MSGNMRRTRVRHSIRARCVRQPGDIRFIEKGFLDSIAHYICVEITITVITHNYEHGSIDIQMVFWFLSCPTQSSCRRLETISMIENVQLYTHTLRKKTRKQHVQRQQLRGRAREVVAESVGDYSSGNARGR